MHRQHQHGQKCSGTGCHGWGEKTKKKSSSDTDSNNTDGSAVPRVDMIGGRKRENIFKKMGEKKREDKM